MNTTVETAHEVVDEPSKSTAVSPLSPLEKVKAGLIQLATESKNFDLTNAAGEKAARVFRAKCVSLRTALDDAYEAVNRPLLQTQRDARALRDDVKAQVQALEGPVDKLIKDAEAAREVERIRKAEAEANRIAALNARIDEIKAVATRAVGKPSAEVEAKIQLVAGMAIGDTYQELKPAAEQAQAATLATLRELHTAALAQEAEAERIAADRAELERLRAAQAEADRVERARIAAEQKTAQARIDEQRAALEKQQREAAERQEKADREARERREEADRKAAAERAEADRVARIARETEEQRLAVERYTLRKEQEERDRKEREATEARQRAEREAAEAEERARREVAEAEERRQAEIRAEQRRQEEFAAIADKRVRDLAPQLLAALRLVVTMVRAMEAERDSEKPTGEQYQAALAQADEVISLAIGDEAPAPATKTKRAKARR